MAQRRQFSPMALRRLRQQAGMSQYRLCVAAGLSGRIVQKLENNQAPNSPGWLIARLADALDVPMDALFERERVKAS